MKYNINDKVVHSREGLSYIADVTNIGGNDYYVVRKLVDGKENCYVMIDRTDNIIRPIMSEKEAKEVIKYMKTVEANFISNTKQRRDQYKKRLLSGDVLDLAYLARQLYFFNYYNEHGQQVKLGPTDLQMLKDAESILFDEFALSFNCERSEVNKKVAKLLA